MKNTRLLVFILLGITHQLFSQSKDSLDLKIGQMILIGVPGTSVDATVLQEIKDGKAGSIIFFEKNINPKN